MYRFSTVAQGGHSKVDRNALVQWARERFEVDLDLDDLKSKQRDEIRQVLLNHSQSDKQKKVEATATVKEKLESIFRNGSPR